MTNTAIVFDTLRYANRLKVAGVPEKQAEIQAETLAEIIDERLATKQDLKYGLKELEARMTVKLGSIMLVGLGLLVLLMKLFKLSFARQILGYLSVK